MGAHRFVALYRGIANVVMVGHIGYCYVFFTGTIMMLRHCERWVGIYAVSVSLVCYSRKISSVHVIGSGKQRFKTYISANPSWKNCKMANWRNDSEQRQKPFPRHYGMQVFL